MLAIKKTEAYKFYAIKSFFTYIRGPLANAIPTNILIIANVKHITNLDGITIKDGSSKKHISKKKAAMANAIVELIIDLSLDKKLNTDNHPCGSGSGLPRTKFRAYAIEPAILNPPALLFSKSLLVDDDCV